MSFEESENSNT